MDDIIFGGNDLLCKKNSAQMSKEFYMLKFGENKFLIGLKFIKQRMVYM